MRENTQNSTVLSFGLGDIDQMREYLRSELDPTPCGPCLDRWYERARLLGYPPDEAECELDPPEFDPNCSTCQAELEAALRDDANLAARVLWHDDLALLKHRA
jgi:hypothetical protein